MSSTVFSHVSKRHLALGMILITLLVSLLISQRAFLMMVQNSLTPIAVVKITNHSETHTNAALGWPYQTDSDQQNSHNSHSHAEHCPLCFMPWLESDFSIILNIVYSPLLLEKIWLEAAVARAEFLDQVTARAPPRA